MQPEKMIELADILDQEAENVLSALRNCQDKLSEEYHSGLHLLQDLFYMANEYRRTAKSVPVVTPAEYGVTYTAPTPTHTTNAVTDEPSPEPDAPTYTLEEVRKILGKVQIDNPDADVPGAIASFGVKKLSQIPADKYPELLAKVGA